MRAATQKCKAINAEKGSLAERENCRPRRDVGAKSASRHLTETMGKISGSKGEKMMVDSKITQVKGLEMMNELAI